MTSKPNLFSIPFLKRTPRALNCPNKYYDEANTSKRSVIFKPDTIFHTPPRETSAIPLRVKCVPSLAGDITASMTDMFIKGVVCRTDNLPS